MNDKIYLKKLGIDVISLFREKGLSEDLYLRAADKLKLRNSYTDGWLINLGKEKARGFNIHIWFDRWSAYSDRKIWYGIYSRDPKLIIKISKTYIKTIGNPIKLADKDVSENALWNKGKLKNRIPKSYFGRPFLETYYEVKAYFYGIYEFHNLNPIGKGRNQLLDRIIGFYESIFEKPSNSNKHIDTYPRIENRKLVISHIQRERSHHLSTLRKQLDDYRCFICKFKFNECYGDIGNKFAEAHHIIPLSQLNSEITTTVNDLITVCSNCHRMLHKLEGKKTDIQKLIKLIKSNKRI